MKKLYLILLLCSFYLLGNGQNFVYPNGQHMADTVDNLNYESYDIQMRTPTDEDITFKWEVLSNTFDANWSYSVCDHVSCYVGFPPSATMDPITASEMAAGTNGFIKLNLTVGHNYNTGLVEIYVYDAADYNRGDTISFYVHWPVGGTSVDEHSLSFTTYPNPVNSVLNISNASTDNGVIEISDLTGKMVARELIMSTATREIDLSALRPGVYLVTLKDGVGNVSTKRIVKK